jgi:hypothetical protein
MIMEGNMKKEKLIKNKKRGQGLAEYGLLVGGIVIIIAGALILLRQSGLFNHLGSYIRCILRVATAQVGTTQQGANPPTFDGCNACLSGGSFPGGGTNYCN